MDFDAYDYVRFCWPDLNGISRGKVIPRAHVQNMLRQGGVPGYSGCNCMSPLGENVPLPGIADRGHGNMLCRPVDDSSLHPLPWATYGSLKTGEVLCETFWMDGRPQDTCPRYVARKQLDVLKQMGYDLFSGFECEFIVSHKDTGERLFKHNDVFMTLAFAENEAFLYSLESQLRQSGIDIECMHCEFSNGQFELITSTECGIRSADYVFRLKEYVKEIAAKHGYTVTFMSKPYANENGNGLHFNHSLRATAATASKGDDTSRYVFYDVTKPDRMSDVYRWWLGGLIKHGAALTALCSPTVNCYRRLHSSWAPTVLNWGFDDRLATFRVKNYSPASSYVENRLGAGSANPYIIMAATIAAGVDGIKNQISCPVDRDPSAVGLPHTLVEALDALQADKVLCDSLGEEFFLWFKLLREHIDLTKLKDSNVKDFSDTVGFQNERNLYMRYL